MDVLNFTNTGSELTYVAKIGGPAAYGYRGGSGSFFYQHGRMTSGPDISITYNEIGMPTTVLKTTTENIYFVYDAEGRKWRQERSWSPTAPEPYDTNNNVEEKQFSNGLESINDDYLVLHHAEGRSIIENNAVERIEYYMKDHLGNIRLVFSDLDGDGKIDQSENTEEVLETYAYYPFGLEMEGVDEIRQAPAYQSLGYNGKERIGDNLYDYGFRIYMAGIGRWNAVDPLAEEMPGWSPYNYVFNNPILLIDPDGKAPAPPGDYYDRQGNHLGSDGIDDNKLYLVNDGVSARDLGLNSGPFFGSMFSGARTRNTTEVGGLMILNRVSEGENYTSGELTLIGGNKSDFTYTLEPGGPETTTPNQNRRIPDGVYNVDSYSSARYPDNYILSNSEVSQDRRILIHSGNFPRHTLGCILPGCNVGAGSVGDSRNAMNTIRDFYRSNNTSIIDFRDDIKMIVRTNINN